MNLEKILENYGLDEKQAKVYLACLEMGSASVQRISEKAGIPRSTTYEILDFLRDKGFVSTFLKKRVKYFSPEDPKKIITRAKGKIESLEKSLPRILAAYRRTAHQPAVRFYQGKQGMKVILDEILEEAIEIKAFTSTNDLFALLGDYWPDYLRKRIKKKIPVKVITQESAKARERQELGPQELREVKIIPESYGHHGHVFTWNNKVAIFTFKKDLVALVIESEEVARIQEATFDFMWDAC
ncbi:hypothetical protein HQ544_04650 [Candidatus Falkowbacteria bacterium]|nr:hypothetical protein [Candidatus Falkowbacteria bacterium]